MERLATEDKALSSDDEWDTLHGEIGNEDRALINMQNSTFHLEWVCSKDLKVLLKKGRCWMEDEKLGLLPRLQGVAGDMAVQVAKR